MSDEFSSVFIVARTSVCYVDVRCLLYAVGDLSHWVQLAPSHFSVMLKSGACCML